MNNHVQERPVHVVSFSGGLSSAFLVHLMEQKRKLHGWNVHYVFMDTGAEHVETYNFIRKLVKYWGINLVCIRALVNPILGVGVTYREIGIDELKPDLQPWRDMVAKYGLPTINTPRCTSRMKTDPHDKYCDERFGKGNYHTWIGIRADEPARLKHYCQTIDMFDDKAPKQKIRYLAELSGMGKTDIQQWWSKQKFGLDIPPHLGNCVFCVKKQQMKLVAAAQQEPAYANDFYQMLTGDVRVLPNQPFVGDVIYRGHLSMEKVIKLARQLPPELLADEMSTQAMFEDEEPSFCSESCEVFPAADDFELEMYDEKGKAA